MYPCKLLAKVVSKCHFKTVFLAKLNFYKTETSPHTFGFKRTLFSYVYSTHSFGYWEVYGINSYKSKENPCSHSQSTLYLDSTLH